MTPELPYLAAGSVTLAGMTIRNKRFPPSNVTLKVVIGTVVLILVASATNGTKVEPLIRAFGLLVLLVAVMTAVRYNLPRKKTS